MMCADDVHVTPGVVLHEIGQLRQVFAWVWAINLTSNNNRRSGKSDKRKRSWTALHKADWLTCCFFRWFKFTLKPPNRITRDKLRLAIWDTSAQTFWLKSRHKGPWDIS